MKNHRFTSRVSGHPLTKTAGNTQQGLPVAVILLALIVLVAINQLGSPTPWTAPRWDKANRPEISRVFGTWGAVIDSSGWESALQTDLSYLLQPQAFGLPSGGNVYLGNPAKQLETTSRFEGQPRIVAWASTGFVEAQAELYERPGQRTLLSGPVQARVSGPFLGEPTDGLSLDALQNFPRETERVVWLDTDRFRLPDEHRNALRVAWKRWEFQPTESLAAAFASPFCYAQWRGQTIFLFGVESSKKIESELAQRFPKVVMKQTTAWAEGTQITGFGRDENAAWFYRGDYFVATPSNGVESLKGFLNSRFGRNQEFGSRDNFLGELQKLAKSEKRGWHVCVIERNSDRGAHWALLLRILEDGRATGFLVAELQPESTVPKDATH